MTAVLSMTALVAALSAGSVLAQETPKRGGTLVYASLSGPGTLDPQMAASMVDLEVIHNLFEGLVGMDGKYGTSLCLPRMSRSARTAKPIHSCCERASSSQR